MPTIPWQGTVLAIQPRIRHTRSFDERTHTYLGYALRLDGTIGERRRHATPVTCAKRCAAARSR